MSSVTAGSVRLAATLRAATATALRGGEIERSRILLAIALRAELAREEATLRDAVLRDGITPCTPILLPLVAVWEELAPPERVVGVKRIAQRTFAFVGLDASEPFPSHAKPTPADAQALVESTFFKKDAQRVEEDVAAGRGLLLPQAIGATSCDLVAALVQLLLAAPFAPGGFTADMLLALIAALRRATSAQPADDSVASSGAPLDWNAVAALSVRQLRRALREGLDDDFFYEVDEAAASCWRRARAARISAVLRGLRDAHSGASLDWLRSMETWTALRALLALPALTLPAAATLLLFEIQRPLLPICCNALLELKAFGWVPSHAGATAAFLHLNGSGRAGTARLPKDPARIRAVYSCLCQQSNFRLTRQAVVGNGASTPADIAYRERRGAYALQLPVRLAAAAAAEEMAHDISDVHSEDGEDSTIDDGTFIVATSADSPGTGAPPLSLASIVHEYLHHHELYPEAGCTPLVLALRPIDARTALSVSAALANGALPQQQRAGDGAGLRYVLDVPWSAAELEAGGLLLANDGAETSADDVSALTTLLQKLATEEEESGAAGPSLFGFGEQLESGLHLAAKCNCAAALSALLLHAGDSKSVPDAQGRHPLHAACAAGSTDAARILLSIGHDDLTVSDASGFSALALAASSGSSACVRLLLDHGASVVVSGMSPLEAAAGAGGLELVKLLLDHRAVLDAQDANTGRTALHAAARGGHLDVVRFLQDCGASLSLCDRTERLPHEVLPDSLGGEASWLIEAGKAAAKTAPRKTPPRPRAPSSSLMDALTLD